MAENTVDTLRIEIEADAKKAKKNVDDFKKSTSDLTRYLKDIEKYGYMPFDKWKEGVDFAKKLKPLVKDVSAETKTLQQETSKLSKSYKSLSDNANTFALSAKKISSANFSKGFKDVAKIGTSKLFSGFKRDFEGINKQLNYFGAAIKSVLVYSTLSRMLGAITKAVQTGTNNLYQYSKIIDGKFAASMDRLAASLQYFQNSIGAAIAPIINAFAPAIDLAVDKVVELLNAFNQMIAKLTGASSWTKAVKVPKEYAESADKASKANKNLLASFDELNVIQSKDSGSGKTAPDYGSMFEEVPLDGYTLPDFVQQIKDQIQAGDWAGVGRTLGEKVNEITSSVNWEDLGTKVGEGLQSLIDAYNGFMETVDWTQIGASLGDAMNNLLANLNPESVGQAFAQFWNSTVELIYGFVTTTDWTAVGKFLADAISGWFKNVDWTLLGQTFAEALKAMFETAVSFVQNFDWSALLSAFKDFVSGFFDTLGIGEVGDLINSAVDLIVAAIQKLSPVWQEVMIPIGEWTAETLLSTLREVSDLIGDITDLLSGETSFSEFTEQLSPLQTAFLTVSTAATAVVTAIKSWTAITTIISKVGSVVSTITNIFSKAGPAVSILTKAFSLLSSPVGIAAAAIAGVVGVAALLEEKYGTLTTLTEGVGEKLSEVWGTLKETFSAITTYLSDRFTAIGTKFSEIWKYNIKPTLEMLKGLFTDVFQGVVILVNSAINGVMDIFKGLLNFITAVFTGDWKKAIEGICSVFEGVTGIVKGVVNAVIAVLVGLLNAIISGVESTINWVLNGVANWINGIADKIEKLADLIGKDIDLNISIGKVSLPRVPVPKLASGGVITSPTFAQIGEYPGAASNPEIVAPQSVIYDTVVSANGEQERLLREQNSLLRQLLQKDSTVVIAPSAALGRVNAKSKQMYEAAAGAY